MGMYYGVLLTPVDSDSTPSKDTIIKLLNWLVKQGDIAPITDSYPVKVITFLHPDSDIEQEVNFKDTGDDLKSFLNQNQYWVLRANSNFSPKIGLLSKALELRGVDETGESQEGEWSASLQDIEVFHMNVKSYLDWGATDPSKLDKDFAILLNSDMKAGEPIEEAEEYFELVSPRLISSGAIIELEQVLGFKLEAQPFVA